jgi:hypothetical protein
MPRIRTVKPEFWTDGDVVDMSPYARLLFLGSWNFALCDRGHVADDPKRLKMQVLPADDVNASDLIDEIITHGRMVRLTAADGRTYLHIKRFTDHQKIEKRWTPRCPACEAFGLNEAPATPDNPAEPPQTSREVEGDTTSLAETPRTSAPEGKGKEGKGRDVKPATASRGTRIPDDFAITEDMYAWARANAPGVNVPWETQKFIDYWRGISGVKGVKLDWAGTWRNWIRRQVEDTGPRLAAVNGRPTVNHDQWMLR